MLFIFGLMNTTNRTCQTGYNISRIRELRGMKQEALAIELGVSQQTVSNIEKSAVIEADLLVQIAEILGVTAEAIENFDEDRVLDMINKTFTGQDTLSLNTISIHPTFNSFDKLVEAYEENKKLYERLIEAEKEKIAYLERLTNGAKH